MNILSNRVTELTVSETIQMAKYCREMQSKGIEVIDLGIGEPDFTTPEHIREGAKQAIDDGYTHYTPVSGYLDLREAISQKFKRDNGLDYDADQIVVSTGAKQSLANIVLSILDRGDQVILPAPYWVSYAALVKLVNGEAVTIPTTIETDFKVSPEQIEEAISPKTKIYLFSSPCNPSGSVYSKDELKEMAEVFARYPDLIIISDEIYEYINYTPRHESIAQFDEIKDRVVTVNGVSKGFAMTGWRLGYIGAPKEIAEACDKVQGQITSGASSITQKAALTALTSDMTPTDKMREKFLQRRDVVIDLVKQIPEVKLNVPQGAFYLFPDVSAYYGKTDGKTIINDSNDLCMYLLEKAHVALVTGKAFGMNECVRISYAASTEKLKTAMGRIKEAFSELM